MNLERNNTEQMISLIAAGIPENDPKDLMIVWNHMKALGTIDYPTIKELETAGIPMLEELSGVMDLSVYEVAITSRLLGIDFSFVEMVFKNLTVPGGKFNKQYGTATTAGN